MIPPREMAPDAPVRKVVDTIEEAFRRNPAAAQKVIDALAERRAREIAEANG